MLRVVGLRVIKLDVVMVIVVAPAKWPKQEIFSTFVNSEGGGGGRRVSTKPLFLGRGGRGRGGRGDRGRDSYIVEVSKVV